MYQKLRLPSENLVCTIYNGRNLQLEILISSYALEMQVLRPYKEYQQVTSSQPPLSQEFTNNDFDIFNDKYTHHT